ncbi:MAG: L,D-transpeptidase [Bradyrhizobiaceae bacterium]|nr:MAG: L,D-transpeptidase [Bradyrhizobiaceae bacterium]
MGAVGSVRAASKTSRPGDGRVSKGRRGRVRHAIVAAALGLIAVGSVAPAAAWHTPGLERWRGYDPYWRPYAIPPRPPARPRKRARPAEPARTGLAEIAKGQLHIVISLNAQRLQVYSDGLRVAESPVSTGTASHPTPTGLFNVIQKNRFHRSNLYSNAPMPFMQRLTWSGIALHEGHLPGYPASHGCIRLPRAFAQELWRTTRLGVRVIVAQDEVAPVAIAHAQLAALAPKPDEEEAPTRSTETAAPVRMAAASITDAGAEQAPAATREDGSADVTGILAAKDLPLRPGPVSLFVSRKDGKLYVRKGFEPIYSAPVTIRDKDKPLGTHLFTALSSDGDRALRWTVISLADTTNRRIAASEPHGNRGRRARAAETPPPSTVQATAALERIQIPQDAVDFVSDLVSPGAALIVSDQGLGHETGLGTDFIIVTQ